MVPLVFFLFPFVGPLQAPLPGQAFGFVCVSFCGASAGSTSPGQAFSFPCVAFWRS